jgi:hypothetical protein
MWLWGEVLFVLPDKLVLAEVGGQTTKVAEVVVPEQVSTHDGSMKDFIHQFACRHRRNPEFVNSFMVLLHR